MSTALVPINVEGWTLFREGAASFWVRDIDLAEQAGLAEPRKIRRVIDKAIEDKAVALVGGLAAPANGEALARIEQEVTTSGKGRAQPVDVYYLNREAAVLVVMRLRTERAVQLQVAVVRVFLRAIEGQPGATPPRLPPRRVAAPRGLAYAERDEWFDRLRAWARGRERFTAQHAADHLGVELNVAARSRLGMIFCHMGYRLTHPGDGAAPVYVAVRPLDPPAPVPSPEAQRIDRLERLVEQLVGAVATMAAARAPRRRLPPPPSGQPELPFPLHAAER